MTDKTHYITQEGLDKLEAELHELKTIKRPDVVKKIEVAKEFGDLSENAEYQFAKEELAFIDGRLSQLDESIHNAVIIEKGGEAGLVHIGSTVVAKGGEKEITYRIVGADEADPKAGLISNESPMGKAFIGKRVGEAITVSTPSGEVVYEIVRVE